MYVHVLMLCRMFELILIKMGFFMNFIKLLKNWVKVPVLWYMVTGQKLPKLKWLKFSILIIFPDAYTCTYAA